MAEKNTPSANDQINAFEDVLLQQSLWWKLLIPIEVVEMLSISPKVTSKPNFSSNHRLLKWLSNPTNTQGMHYSQAFVSLINAKEGEVSFFERIDAKQLIQISSKIEFVLLNSNEQAGLTVEVQTPAGKRSLMIMLRCIIEPDDIYIWAQLFDAQLIDRGNEHISLLSEEDSVELVYERQLLLEEQNKVVRSLFQKQSRFLAMLSHELRSPLLGLQAMAKRLSQKYQQSDELQTSFASMSSTVEYLSYLINDILTFSQTEFNSLQLYPHEFLIKPLVDDIRLLTQDIADQKKLKIEVDYSGSNTTVFGDRVRLKQVLLNLVVNGIKFTQQGGIRIGVIEKGNGDFIFSVKDTGEGISEAKLDRIFEPFLQLDSLKGQNQFGAGLGLFIVKQLVELMGGTIKVTSVLGKGTEFTFRLNLRATQSDKRSTQIRMQNKAAFEVQDFTQSAKSVNRASPDNPAAQKKLSDSVQHPDVTDFMDDSRSFSLVSEFDNPIAEELKQVDQIFDEVMEDLPPKLERDLQNVSVESVKLMPKSVRPPLKNAMAPINVLIAEDSDLNRWVLVDLLSEFGCTVTEAINGQEAWEAFQKNPYELVILDIQMPLLSGIQVARKIRNHPDLGSNLKVVIAITAGGNELLFKEENESLEGLFDDWLLKPAELNILRAVLIKHNLLTESVDEAHNNQAILEKSVEQPEQNKDSQNRDEERGASKSENSEKVAGESSAGEISTVDGLDEYSQIPAYFLHLFPDFVVQTQSAIDEMMTLSQRKDWEALAAGAHKLKGNMMLFNLTHAVDFLKDLENTVKSDDNPDFKQEISHKMCKNLRTLVKKLEKSHSIINN